MIRREIHSSHGTSDLNIFEIPLLYNDVIQWMPFVGAGVRLSNLVLVSLLEHGIGNG